MKVILCRGTFDLLHIAHLRHLKEARSWGDYLVVSLNTDRNATVEKRKPIVPERERMEMLLSLRCVSSVDLCDDYLESLERWMPAIYCKGSDYRKKGLLLGEKNFCSAHGIEIRFTKPNPQTTTGLIARIKG